MRFMGFDEKADAILAEVAEAGKKLRTLMADVTITVGKTVQVGDLVLKNGEYGRLTLQTKGAPRDISQTLYDGAYVYEVNGREYTRTEAKSTSDFWPFLFGFDSVEKGSLFYKGREDFEGTVCDVLAFRAPNQNIFVYITPERLILGYTAQIGTGQKQEMRLTKIRIDRKLQEAFQLPAGVVLKKEAHAVETKELEKSLPRVGKPAPPLKLTTASGRPMVLPNKGVTLVTFWTMASGPCRVILPELQKLFLLHKKQGFQVYALNPSDPPATILAFCRARGYTFSVASVPQSTVKDFGAETFPTSFLIDAKGVVVYRSVGFQAAALRVALEKVGLSEVGAL